MLVNPPPPADPALFVFFSLFLLLLWYTLADQLSYASAHHSPPRLRQRCPRLLRLRFRRLPRSSSSPRRRGTIGFLALRVMIMMMTTTTMRMLELL